jgi:hypothetical protein
MQVRNGQTLIRDDARLPELLPVRGDRLQGGWLLSNYDAHEIDRAVRAADWHFFWIIDESEGRSVGRTQNEALISALQEALRKVDYRLNAAEVVQIKHRWLAGLHFVCVRLAGRHIQPSAILGMTESAYRQSPRLGVDDTHSFKEMIGRLRQPGRGTRAPLFLKTQSFKS